MKLFGFEILYYRPKITIASYCNVCDGSGFFTHNLHEPEFIDKDGKKHLHKYLKRCSRSHPEIDFLSKIVLDARIPVPCERCNMV